jgi:hypothetical protein
MEIVKSERCIVQVKDLEFEAQIEQGIVRLKMGHIFRRCTTGELRDLLEVLQDELYRADGWNKTKTGHTLFSGKLQGKCGAGGGGVKKACGAVGVSDCDDAIKGCALGYSESLGSDEEERGL